MSRFFSSMSITSDRSSGDGGSFVSGPSNGSLWLTSRRVASQQVPGLHLALALDRDRAAPLAFELVLEQRVGRGGDLDPVRRPRRFHPAPPVPPPPPAGLEEPPA